MPSKSGPNDKPYVLWTHEVRAEFLENLAKSGRKADSALAAGVTYQTLKNHMKLDPALPGDVENALELYKDSIRKEIHRRAVKGIDKPVFYQGDICGYITEFSDRMLELEAKRHMPEYRDRQQVDHNIKGGVLVVPVAAEKETPDVWAERANSVSEN